jgi:hypothetical protein
MPQSTSPSGRSRVVAAADGAPQVPSPPASMGLCLVRVSPAHDRHARIVRGAAARARAWAAAIGMPVSATGRLSA